MNAIEYPDDCKRLRDELLQSFQIEATLSECQDFWRWASEQMSASWLCLSPTPQLAEDIKRWLPEYWDRHPEREPNGDHFNPRYHL